MFLHFYGLTKVANKKLTSRLFGLDPLSSLWAGFHLGEIWKLKDECATLRYRKSEIGHAVEMKVPTLGASRIS